MKRLIPLLILMLTTLTDAFSQTYDQFWKEEQQAAQKDLPKTQITVLEKIAAKATKEKAYGQLLASTLKQASLKTIIAPDSLQPAIDWLTARATAAEGHDEALAAVYNTVLGHIFTNNSALGDNHEAQGKAYYQKALAHPNILGRTKAAGFEPLVGEGKDATLFGDDLLNVIAREVNDWATLADYYKKSGNREAACYASLKAKSEEGRVKSEEFNSSSSSKQTNWLSPSAPTCGSSFFTLPSSLNKNSSLFTLPSSLNKNSSFFTLHSSLLEEYSDLPICGEVAIALYDELDNADVTPKEKYDYCTEAIRRWSTWPRMNVLRNEQLRLTAALLHQRTEHKIVAPGTPQTVKLTVRNIASATLTITRLDITGDTDLNPSNSNELATLRTKAVSGSRQTVSRTYSGHAAYDIIEDSLTIPALTTGVYLLEFSTNENSVNPLRSLYRVTSVFPLYQPQPDETMRIAVVDLQTGQPKPHAKVKILPYTRYGKTVEGRTLTTDAKGEVVLDSSFFTHHSSRNIWAYTETDKASPTTGMWGDYYCYSDTAKREFGHLYTDRQIYRPGQTAHAAVVVYERQGIETKAIAGRNIKLTLRDANYKDVSEQTVKTDDFGTASADFTLPTDGLTGRFTIAAESFGQTSIQVEEYKRPTFEVELPEVTEAYKAGDTLTVIGTARTYAGVPVQNAKVSYTVNRREALWWWWRTGESDEELLRNETTTDADGRFTIRMPLLLPDEDEDDDDDDTESPSFGGVRGGFYNFVVSANVTDLGGESHEGSLSIPLGTKPTAFSLEMKDKFLADSTKTLRFNYRNAAGKPIDGTVRLTIDDGPELTVKANETLDLEAQLHTSHSTLHTSHSTLHTGKHQLVAVCGTDTLTHDFIVFSLSDWQPVVETHDWFYISADEFPQDDSPVYVQVGSSDPDQHILYSIFSGKKLLESGAIDQSCTLTNRKFTYKKEYGDGILLTFAWVKDGQLYTHSEDIRRPMPDKHLKLTWKTFRDRLTPGQDEEWTLSIQRPAGSLPTGEGWGGASLMATLYDKSLDQLSRHAWSFEPNLAVGLPGTSWRGLNLDNYPWYDSSTASYKSLRVGQLAFRSLNADYYQNLLYPFRYQYARAGGPLRMMKRANINMAVTDAAMDRTEAPMVMESVEEDLAGSALGIDGNALQETVVVGYGAQKCEQVSVSVGQNDESSSAEPQLRENLAETAFFYPQLVSDAQGQVAIKFRLPESVTTWRFLGFAHDKDMNYGFIDAEAVAKKAVMVSPNVPRFVRQGDHATLTARIFNTSDHAVSGKARLELVKATALAEISHKSDVSDKSDISDKSDKSNVSDTSEYSEELPFSLSFREGSGEVCALTFHLPATLAPDLYIVRITAQGNGFSDGEQHYLPVLTNTEYVTTTLPLTFLNAADTTINASQLFPSGTIAKKGNYSPLLGEGQGGEASGGEASFRRLTVEYTQNPEWLAIQALPYMSVPDGDNAISLATAFFANTLGRAILTSHPSIRQAIELWQREQGDDKTLLSALEKNQELKTLVLKETPWVAEADAEREQRQSLIRFFDDNTLQNNLRTIEQKLQKLQNPDGSFSWWQGMEGSPYMTMSVVKMLVRLEALLKEKSEKRKEANAGQAESKAFSGQANYSPLLGEGLGGEAVESAFSYLSKVVADRVREMKEWEKKGHKNPFPSDLLCDYAYTSALAGHKATSDILYIVSKMEAAKSVLSIYGKANTAVILHLYGRNARANDHLKSLKEYTVYRKEMGRYFDTPKANYSWCDYRTPSQVAAIEALRYLTPNDKQTITEMQRWLLQEKRTTMWSTPINCVEAVYGSLSPSPSPIGRGADSSVLSMSSDTSDKSDISDKSNNSTHSPKITILNAEGILAEKAISPIATTKVSTPITSTENLEVKLIAPLPTGEGQGERLSGTGLSFGAIYAQYLQDMKEIEASNSGLTVKREVMLDGKTLKEGTRLKVGDRIKVRITIRADRDYDFVQVVDKRAACLEPVEQTSGYRYGYYIAPKDQETRYYFDQMAKGTHTFETEYYVDREGDYLSGTCAAQCAYSPEFMGRTGGQTLSVYR